MEVFDCTKEAIKALVTKLANDLNRTSGKRIRKGNELIWKETTKPQPIRLQ